MELVWVFFTVGAIVWPLAAGFLIPFQPTRVRRRACWLVGNLPMLLVFGTVIGYAEMTPRLMQMLWFVAFSMAWFAIFTILGQAFGKPFAEIRQEKQDKKLEETFQ